LIYHLIKNKIVNIHHIKENCHLNIMMSMIDYLKAILHLITNIIITDKIHLIFILKDRIFNLSNMEQFQEIKYIKRL